MPRTLTLALLLAALLIPASSALAAKSGYRILIMPGVYQEMASRKTPVGTPGQEPCANDYAITEGFSNQQIARRHPTRRPSIGR